MKLNFYHDAAAGPALSFEVSELTVTGCEIGGFADSHAVTRLTTSGWTYAATCFPVVAVTGGACLLFDTAHKVSFICDPVDHLYFIGCALSANGVAIAKYNSVENLWQGVLRPLWYRSFRIVGAESAAAALAGRTQAHMNPWETYMPCMSTALAAA